MMEMGIEMGIGIGIGIGTGGDGDDDFPINDDRAQLFFLLTFLSCIFLLFSFIFPIKRHDTALTRMKMTMVMNMHPLLS